MKKTIAKEFICFLLTGLFSFFLAFLFLICLDLSTAKAQISEEEKIFVIQFYLVGFLVSFIGIYLIRLIIGAMKALAETN